MKQCVRKRTKLHQGLTGCLDERLLRLDLSPLRPGDALAREVPQDVEHLAALDLDGGLQELEVLVVADGALGARRRVHDLVVALEADADGVGRAALEHGGPPLGGEGIGRLDEEDGQGVRGRVNAGRKVRGQQVRRGV